MRPWIEEGTDSQHQSQYADKGNVGGPADDLREDCEIKTGSEQIEQANQGSKTKEVHHSDSKILFHISFLLRFQRFFLFIFRSACFIADIFSYAGTEDDGSNR